MNTTRTCHTVTTEATLLERATKRIVIAFNEGAAAFVEVYSLRKSGRWVRVGDPDVWGAHRLEGV